MTATNAKRASLGGVRHHCAKVNGTVLHYVAAGTEGTPVLLVHGFPETWWTFRKLIPLLAARHRVYAVDLRGFGDSDNGPGTYDSKTSAEDLHLLIEDLNVGPVHLTGQDISGATVLRLAVTHPEDVLSFTAIEMGLPGFGLEKLADVTHGGTWHIGVLAAPRIPEMLLAGREREFLGQFAFPAMSATPGAITDTDIDEFVRTYSRRLARCDRPLPVHAPRRRRDRSPCRRPQTEHPSAGDRSWGRRAHLFNDEPGQLGSSLVSDSSRRRPLRRPRGTRQGGRRSSRLLQHC
jgi:pimeloyl-ACP methyl ester carboxylesterase